MLLFALYLVLIVIGMREWRRSLPSAADAHGTCTASASRGLARRYVPGAARSRIERLGAGSSTRATAWLRDGRMLLPANARLPSGADLGVDRAWECRVLARRGAAGIAPRIERCEPRAACWWRAGWRAAPGRRTRRGAGRYLARMAELVRRIHALALAGHGAES